MKYCFKYVLFFLFIAFIVSCKKPYDPPAIASPGSYLVVEGAINSGSDSTIITLSRTVSLSSASTVNPVLGATVAVESDQNIVYPLAPTGNGDYVSPGLNLNNSHTYRLSIQTDNEQYYSDYVAVLNSPPIDSINFTTTSNSVNIYSNTHDPTNTVKYYRFSYQETWIINAAFDSGFISNGDTVLTRTASQQVYTCWSNDASSDILINSTAKLSSDVLVNNPVTSIASTSEKIGNEYSILVKQYALTADAYNFWTNLKTNTEELGSIFDAQPSSVNGNLHCITNPSEPVIGYISVGAVASKRVFIRNQQLPDWPAPQYPYPCMVYSELYVGYVQGDPIPVNQVNEFINYDKGATNPLIPIAPISVPQGPILGYTASTPECVECTLRGTNIQPSFWIY